MSVKLFNLLVKSLRQNLPRYSLVKPGVQARSITAMEVITETVDEKNPDIVKDKVFTRYKKRYMKRQWEEVDAATKDGETENKKVCDKPFERIKRKKMAMLVGYCGVNYYGMQRNPGVPTIEEKLLKALHEAKYITEDDFVNQQNAQFQRSSRTDKGVSAARQVVSLKLPLEASIEEINKQLPEDIRVFGIKRVTNRFNSKSKCNARTYSYTLPTFTFEPSADDEEKRKLYRITAEKMSKVNEVLEFYKGTKSYHNFTEKKHYQDPSASRYMMSFTLDRVFVTSDMEFAVLLVKGQSFMLHQIRKMVGLMVAVVRGQTDMSIMNKAFGKEKVMIPTVPGLGLVLDKVHYERYDTKFKNSHGSLTWDKEDEVIEKFIHDQIYPSIVKGEVEGNSMATWLEKLQRHSFEPSEDVPEDKDATEAGDDDDDDDDAVEDEDIDEVKEESEDKVKETKATEADVKSVSVTEADILEKVKDSNVSVEVVKNVDNEVSLSEVSSVKCNEDNVEIEVDKVKRTENV